MTSRYQIVFLAVDHNQNPKRPYEVLDTKGGWTVFRTKHYANAAKRAKELNEIDQHA
jgi:hypothetical protein